MTYRIGDQDVGVRTTSREFGDWVDYALGAYRVRTKVEPEYSIVIDGGEDDPARLGKRFHILYQGVGAVIRTMNIDTLGRSFTAELDARLLRPRRDAVYAHYGVAWSGDVTVLVPAWLVAYLSGTGRRLRRSGISLSATRWVAIDRETAEVLPERRFVDTPPNTFERIPFASDAELDRPIFTERRHVDAVLTYVPELDTIASGARANALHHLAGATANLQTLKGEAMGPLGELVAGAHCFEFGLGRAQQMLQMLELVFDHERRHHDHGHEEEL